MTLQMPLEKLSLEELMELQTQKRIELKDLRKTEDSVRDRRLEAERQEHLITNAINRKKLGLDS